MRWLISLLLLLVMPFSHAELLAYNQQGLRVVRLQPVPGNQHIKKQWQPLQGLAYEFEVTQTSLVTIYGHVGFRHAQQNARNTMIGLDVRDERNARIPGFLVTTNLHHERHYEDIGLNGSYQVQPGKHRFQVMARMAMNGDGHIRLKAPQYSGVWVRIEPLFYEASQSQEKTSRQGKEKPYSFLD